MSRAELPNPDQAQLAIAGIELDADRRAQAAAAATERARHEAAQRAIHDSLDRLEGVGPRYSMVEQLRQIEDRHIREVSEALWTNAKSGAKLLEQKIEQAAAVAPKLQTARLLAQEELRAASLQPGSDAYDDRLDQRTVELYVGLGAQEATHFHQQYNAGQRRQAVASRAARERPDAKEMVGLLRFARNIEQHLSGSGIRVQSLRPTTSDNR